MNIQIRYSKKDYFRKYIMLDQAVAKEEAETETAQVAELFVTDETKTDHEICEEAFNVLNVHPGACIDQYDLKRLGVGHTSMSVGDICVVRGNWYQVMPVGFEVIDG